MFWRHVYVMRACALLSLQRTWLTDVVWLAEMHFQLHYALLVTWGFQTKIISLQAKLPIRMPWKWMGNRHVTWGICGYRSLYLSKQWSISPLHMATEAALTLESGQVIATAKGTLTIPCPLFQGALEVMEDDLLHFFRAQPHSVYITNLQSR